MTSLLAGKRIMYARRRSSVAIAALLFNARDGKWDRGTSQKRRRGDLQRRRRLGGLSAGYGLEADDGHEQEQQPRGTGRERGDVTHAEKIAWRPGVPPWDLL